MTDMPRLTQAERGRIREHVRTLVSYVTATRMREIAKESKLLGKEGTRASSAELKRLLPDGDKLAAVVADALDSRAGQRAALVAIARLGEEAFRSERADARIGVIFGKARSALLEGDWDRMAARLEQFHTLGAVDDAKLIYCADFVLAAALGEPSRLRAVLASRHSLLASPVSPTGASAAVQEARPPEAPAAPLTIGTEPPERAFREPAATPPVAESGKRNERRSPRSTLDEWRNYIDALPESQDLGLEGAAAAQLANESISRIRERFSSLAPLAASRPGVADLEQAAAELRGLATETVAQVQNFLTVHERFLRQVEADHELLSRAVVGAHAPSPSLASALVHLDELRHERVSLAGQAREALQSLEKCAAALPDWIGWSDLAGVEQPALGLRAGVAQLRAFAATALAAVAEASRLRAEEEEISQALRPQGAAQDGGAVAPRADGLRFSAARQLPASFPTSPFYAAHLRRSTGSARTDAGELPWFLPMTIGDHEPPVLTTTSTAAEQLLTVAAANLLRHWAPQCANDHYLPSRLLALVADARVLCDAAPDTFEAEMLAHAALGLALESCADDRTRASARRRRGAILTALTVEQVTLALLASLRRVADRPAMARASAELIRHGFGSRLMRLLGPCAESDAVAGRALASAIAAAIAGLAATEFLAAELPALGVAAAEVGAITDFLEDSQRDRKTRVEAPVVSGAPIVADLVRELGSRFRERGAGESHVNASLPRDLGAARVYALAGSSSVEFPLLISSSGPSGAVGVEVVLQRPARANESVVAADFITERHVAWLSGRNLRESASTLVPCRVDVDEERIGSASELELTVRCNWIGAGPGASSQLTVPLTHAREPLQFREIVGVGGQPVDLLEGNTLELSSESVRRCFTGLREALAAGKGVRAVVYGRRRRGKSSISLSLSQDSQVATRWHIVRDQLNATPLGSLATALERLAALLANGLRAADVPAAPPVLASDNRDRAVLEYQQWLREVCALANKPIRILLLMDEFQRWLSRLTRNDAQSLLTVLREFNERALGHVEVSFVLFGLRNLWDLTNLSNDFRLAVDRWEIKPFTLKETEAYLGAVVEPKLDGRAQRRLWQLSGGNPYVLNRLCDSLQNYLRRQERGWATMLDIEALVEDEGARDGRLDDFLAYMVREGEEDSAPTLRELTVLRAVASTLHDRRDYDGDARCGEVESWLDRQKVRREPGVPVEQLRELSKVGILEERPAGRYALPGEWICRQLALMSAELQPVVVSDVSPLILNRFREKRTLARGGQSDVLLVENVVEGGNDVVLKIYRGAHDLLAVIEREQRLLSRIHHPFVVKCLGAQVDRHRGGVVILQRVEGDSLKFLLDERPEAARSILPGGDLSLVMEVFIKVADALTECHACDIAHKDLTPANIMVAQRLGEWTPTLIDFGIAGIEGESDDPLGGTTDMISAGYTAPEKLNGGRRSRASDIWALGMVVLHMVTGRSPASSGFDHMTTMQGSALPSKLRELLGRMLSEDPAMRPQAPEVRDLLRTALVPTTWSELAEAALVAALDEKWPDAAELALQAMNIAPREARDSAAFLEHVRTTLLEIMPNQLAKVPWFREVHGHVVALAAQQHAFGEGWKRLLDQVFDSQRPPAERETLLRLANDQLDCAPRGAGVAPALLELAGRQLPEALMGGCFDLLADYTARSLIPRQGLVDFCVRAARVGAVRDAARARAWLARATRLGGMAEQACQRLTSELKLQSSVGDSAEPIRCERFVGADVGEDEKGHLAFDRIQAFAERVHRRHGFVCGVRRVGRERGNMVARPTLLPLESVKGVRRADVASVSSIYALLDETYTKRDGALRVQILLAATTTAAQREEAFRRLADEEDLFDVRR